MKQGNFVMPDMKKFGELIQKYKLILLVLAVGAFLLLLPDGNGEQASESIQSGNELVFDLKELEERMENVLSKIDGAGDLSIVLTIKSGGEKIYAADTEYSEDGDRTEERVTTVLVSGESGTKEPAVVRLEYPVFQGALVVCDGGDDPSVRLLITKAVSALTGLGADKITVCK